MTTRSSPSGVSIVLRSDGPSWTASTASWSEARGVDAERELGVLLRVREPTSPVVLPICPARRTSASSWSGRSTGEAILGVR
jgi:hypothetical protein